MNTQNAQHALLPIHIIKKSVDGSIIGKKNIHFQINSGNTYNISYKFFMPRGFHLASNAAPEVNCRLVNNHLNIPSVTFTYVKNGTPNQHHAQPITVRYVNANNNQKISQQLITGNYDQNVNILQRVPMPSGYHILPGQKTNFVIRDHAQTINMMVKPNQTQASNPQPAQTQTSSQPTRPAQPSQPQSAQPVAHDHQDNGPQQLQRDFDAHQNHVKRGLIQRIQQRNLQFLKKVTTDLVQSTGYQDTTGLKADTAHHKVIGRIQKSSNQDSQSAYLRSRRYDDQHPVSVSEIRDFVTCVMDNHANKGIFITTSSFSSSAQQEAQRHRIQTIDGSQLAHLMIQNGIGTKLQHLYRVIKIDPHFFN